MANFTLINRLVIDDLAVYLSVNPDADLNGLRFEANLKNFKTLLKRESWEGLAHILATIQDESTLEMILDEAWPDESSDEIEDLKNKVLFNSSFRGRLINKYYRAVKPSRGFYIHGEKEIALSFARVSGESVTDADLTAFSEDEMLASIQYFDGQQYEAYFDNFKAKLSPFNFNKVLTKALGGQIPSFSFETKTKLVRAWVESLDGIPGKAEVLGSGNIRHLFPDLSLEQAISVVKKAHSENVHELVREIFQSGLRGGVGIPSWVKDFVPEVDPEIITGILHHFSYAYNTETFKLLTELGLIDAILLSDGTFPDEIKWAEVESLIKETGIKIEDYSLYSILPRKILSLLVGSSTDFNASIFHFDIVEDLLYVDVEALLSTEMVAHLLRGKDVALQVDILAFRRGDWDDILKALEGDPVAVRVADLIEFRNTQKADLIRQLSYKPNSQYKPSSQLIKKTSNLVKVQDFDLAKALLEVVEPRIIDEGGPLFDILTSEDFDSARFFKECSEEVKLSWCSHLVGSHRTHGVMSEGLSVRWRSSMKDLVAENYRAWDARDNSSLAGEWLKEKLAVSDVETQRYVYSFLSIWEGTLSELFKSAEAMNG